jgi:hypothetical protein
MGKQITTITAQEVADRIDNITPNGLGGDMIRREEGVAIADDNYPVSGGRTLAVTNNRDGDIVVRLKAV